MMVADKSIAWLGSINAFLDKIPRAQWKTGKLGLMKI